MPRKAAVDRRTLLKGIGAAALILEGRLVRYAKAAQGGQTYISACRLPDGGYAVAELDESGSVTRLIPLPERGHGFAISYDRRQAVAFARYPHSFAMAFTVGGAAAPELFAAPPGRHFYGHGVFADRDRLVLATENDFDGARGVIGVYDVQAGFRRIGEFDTHGVGPHELVMMADGRTLAIANGGIETHPAAGDAKLNVPDMDPSIVFLDPVRGDLISQHRLGNSLRQLSIRHLAVDAGGLVWFGCQYEGPATDQPPLIGRAGPQSDPLMVEEPAELRLGFRNYIGSVAANCDGSVIAASSADGGRIVFLDRTGAVLGSQVLRDATGLAANGRGFLATSGSGEVLSVEARISRQELHADLWFDNHLSLVGGL